MASRIAKENVSARTLDINASGAKRSAAPLRKGLSARNALSDKRNVLVDAKSTAGSLDSKSTPGTEKLETKLEMQGSSKQDHIEKPAKKKGLSFRNTSGSVTSSGTKPVTPAAQSSSSQKLRKSRKEQDLFDQENKMGPAASGVTDTKVPQPEFDENDEITYCRDCAAGLREPDWSLEFFPPEERLSSLPSSTWNDILFPRVRHLKPSEAAIAELPELTMPDFSDLLDEPLDLSDLTFSDF